jgi:hypothetical protein
MDLSPKRPIPCESYRESGREEVQHNRRVLSGPRATAGGRRRRAKATPAVRHKVLVHTCADSREPVPGFVEADLVAHGGETMAGSSAHTLVLIDIASGWTECVALVVREGRLIVDALERLRLTLPFAPGSIRDNGATSSTRRCSRFAGTAASPSRGPVCTTRTTKRGSSRRTDRSSGGSSATGGRRASSRERPRVRSVREATLRQI